MQNEINTQKNTGYHDNTVTYIKDYMKNHLGLISNDIAVSLSPDRLISSQQSLNLISKTTLALMNQAIHDGNDIISLLQTMGNGIGNIEKELYRLRDISESIISGQFSNLEINKISEEYNSSLKRIDYFAENSSYNGQKMLNTSCDQKSRLQILPFDDLLPDSSLLSTFKTFKNNDILTYALTNHSGITYTTSIKVSENTRLLDIISHLNENFKKDIFAWWDDNKGIIIEDKIAGPSRIDLKLLRNGKRNYFSKIYQNGELSETVFNMQLENISYEYKIRKYDLTVKGLNLSSSESVPCYTEETAAEYLKTINNAITTTALAKNNYNNIICDLQNTIIELSYHTEELLGGKIHDIDFKEAATSLIFTNSRMKSNPDSAIYAQASSISRTAFNLL